jgi:hypothetical protein
MILSKRIGRLAGYAGSMAEKKDANIFQSDHMKKMGHFTDVDRDEQQH